MGKKSGRDSSDYKNVVSISTEVGKTEDASRCHSKCVPALIKHTRLQSDCGYSGLHSANSPQAKAVCTV